MNQSSLPVRALKKVHESAGLGGSGAAVLLCLLFLLLDAPLSAIAQSGSSQQAIEMMQAGRFHEAEAILRQIAVREPGNATVHANLGMALAEQGELAAAAAEYRKSLALHPDAEVSLNLGLAEFKQGKFSAAIGPFKSAASAGAQDKRIPLLLGMSYYGLREYSSAVPYLEKASKSDPANLEMHSVLAQSCLWSKKYDCALAEFKTILTANPDAVQTHMMLAEALDAMNRKPEAIEELEIAERNAPNEPMLHFELGYLYYTQHDYDKAAPELELEIRNNPGYAQAYTYLGDIALHKGDDATAESLLDKATRLQNDLRLAYFDLGCAYADQKRNQQALAAFLRAEQLDPTEPDAHYRLARIYLALDQKQKADREFAMTRNLHAKTEESLIQKVSGTEQPRPGPTE